MIARRRPPHRRPALAVVALVIWLGTACGGDDDATEPPADCDRVEGGEVTLVAQNLAWDTDCLLVEEGTTVTFTVDNRDRGVQHNLDITGPSGGANTPIEAGPVVQTLVYEATTAGRHTFVCDPHPIQMKGHIWVV